MTLDFNEDALHRFIESGQNRCFVCGPGNPGGLHLHFRREGDTALAHFTPAAWQGGWQGVVHGGILATVLDEAMAYVLFFRGIQGMTGRLEVRYRQPARYDEMLLVEASVKRETNRVADLTAVLRRDHTLVAEATARYVKVGPLTDLPG